MVTVLKNHEQILIAGGQGLGQQLTDVALPWVVAFFNGAFGSVVYNICQEIADGRIRQGVKDRTRTVIFSGIAWGVAPKLVNDMAVKIAATKEQKGK